MKALPIKLFLFIITVVAIALAGTAAFLLMRAKDRPSLARHGGVQLVYEVDTTAPTPEGYAPEQMVSALQRRLDPNGVFGIEVRAVGGNRFEIDVPGTDPARQQDVKDLLQTTGLLEFRILANQEDDGDAIRAASAFFEKVNDNGGAVEDRANLAKDLEQRAAAGQPPPPPKNDRGESTFEDRKGTFAYAWVELSNAERQSLYLDNAAEKENQRDVRWRFVDAARRAGKAVVLVDYNHTLLYSRPCTNQRLSAEQRAGKKYDYFMLTRLPPADQEVTGRLLEEAFATIDRNEQPAIDFRFTQEGGERFYDLTSANRPELGAQAPLRRHITIILDGQIMSSPTLNEAIRRNGQITGHFTKAQVDALVRILRAGALPAPLKPWPVSERTIEPTK